MYEKLFENLEKKLERLKDENIYRSVKDIESRSQVEITIQGKKYINFASNDYLGLSQHPLVKEAGIEAIKMFGVGGGASRLLSGGTILHRKLEELLSKFKHTESCLVLNSGYIANISLIPTLADEDDVIFSDELNHASIIDGCRLSKAKKFIYRHADIENLKTIIKNTSCKGKKLIITDTVFSMDGDIAPITQLYELCQEEEALLYLDDAHGTGVLGNGYGVMRHFGLESEKFIIQMGTLSKAIGVYGAFVCGDSRLIEWFINSARGFIFATALPPNIVASAYVSLRIIVEDKQLIQRLWQNTEKVMDIVKNLELKTTKTQTPIIPILFKDIEQATKASTILYDSGIYAPVIRPPTVKTPRIRITVTAAHTEDDIQRLSSALTSLSSIL